MLSKFTVGVNTMILLLGIFIQLVCSESLAVRNGLSLINQCTCLGYNQTYECTIATDGGATIWRGTAIDCPEIDDEIILRNHPQEFSERRGCYSRPITAYGVRIEVSSYISRLNITVSDLSMDNRSVQCIYSNGTSTVVGLAYIDITEDPLPPPNDITIIHVTEDTNGTTNLTFIWSPVVLYCPSLRYIITSNCGLCPNTTTMTTIKCRGISVGEQCILTIQSEVCGSIVGNPTTVSVDLKVPDAPVIDVVPTYSHATGSLSAITTSFAELEKFNITYGLDVSAVNYTIIYADAASEIMCLSITFPTSACGLHGICKHVLNFPLSNCSHSIGIRMSTFGTNVFRNGFNSNNFTVGVKNTFVEVVFGENFNTATCKFLQWHPPSDERYRSNCSIVYGYSSRFPASSQSTMGLSSTNLVFLNLSTSDMHSKQEYWFTVTASNGTFTMQMTGIFIVGTSSSLFSVSGLVFGVSIGVLMVIIILITIISVSAIAILVRRKNTTQNLGTVNAYQSKDSSHHIDTERNPAYETVHF